MRAGRRRREPRGARGHPDARKAWRFVFHVENLAALGRAHHALVPLVDELLSQRLGPYRNPLEERAAELTDPMDMPGARALATRLGTAAFGGHTVWVEPDRGVEIALERLIRDALAADVRRLTGAATPRPVATPAGPSPTI